MRVIIAIQARLSSSRLPNKALVDLGGVPLLTQMLRRLRTVTNADGVVIACPEKDAAAIGSSCGVRPIVGPEEDVLTRIMNVLHETEADKIVKVGADCPLIPPDLVSVGIDFSKGAGIVQNTAPRSYPDGFDFEVWDKEILKNLDLLLQGGDREWFTAWALEHVESKYLKCMGGDYSRMRLTVDHPEDLEVIRTIYEAMSGGQWGCGEIIDWCKAHPKVMKLNQKYVKDFGARPK